MLPALFAVGISTLQRQDGSQEESWSLFLGKTCCRAHGVGVFLEYLNEENLSREFYILAGSAPFKHGISWGFPQFLSREALANEIPMAQSWNLLFLNPQHLPAPWDNAPGIWENREKSQPWHSQMKELWKRNGNIPAWTNPWIWSL